MQVEIQLPPKLIDLFDGVADVRVAHGGRGSGKTFSFAKMAAVKGFIFAKAGRRGIILCARQFMNSLDDSSLEELKEAILSEDWLADFYEIGEKYIKSKCGSISFAFAGLARNINSVKSKGRLLLAWVDEAEDVTHDAWQKLDNTLREDGAELWISYNPESQRAAVHTLYRMSKDPMVKVVQLNWRDNPRFPQRLERNRQKCLKETPDEYAHIWDGDFKRIVKGAYYSSHLLQAAKDGRIGRVALDPIMDILAFWDIGSTSSDADATSIWIAQFVGKEIRVIDYYEAVGQELAAHVNWLRDNGYERAKCYLPHDGKKHDNVHKTTVQSALQDAGFTTKVIPNQGKGAALQRVEHVRRLFPRMWFNETKTDAGREALAWYHEKWDENRDIGLGPKHDWSSHAADAFGLMATAHREPVPNKPNRDPRQRAAHAQGWMG